MKRSPLIAVVLVAFVVSLSSAQDILTVKEMQVVYKTVPEEVQYYNPQTGRNETTIVYREIPLEVEVEVPVNPADSARFYIEFVNNYGFDIHVQIDNQTRKMMPGEALQATAFHGQTYSYSRPPQQVSGRWVAGASQTGSVSRNHPTITLGAQSRRTSARPATDESFSVTFVNHYDAPITLHVYDLNSHKVDSATLQPGASAATTVKIGYSVEQEGPVVFKNGTSMSSTRRGTISSKQPIFHLGQ